MTNDEPILVPDKPARSWVLGCSEASIAAGQISVLAVAEVLAAVTLYWWLASHFNWPWMAFVGLIAAPMLLLRSPESVELGVTMLDRYINSNEEDISWWVKISILLLAALATGITVYWLATLWLPGYAGWNLFWRAVVLGAVAVELSFALVIAIAGSSMYSASFVIAVAGTIVVAGAGMVSGVVAGTGMVAGVGLAAGVLAVASTAAVTVGKVFAVTMAPIYALGLLLRGLFIRWIATLRNLPSGLSLLPQNWHETLLVIDLLHSPELLPQAGQVTPNFTVRGLWAKMPESDIWYKTVWSVLLITWYLPALAYRWSLKASAWLWWPLSLALSLPLNGLDGKTIRMKTAISVGGAWRLLLPLVPAVVFAWLSLSAFPGTNSLLHLLPNDATSLAEKLLTLASPPPPGVRYVMLWLGCIFALAFWWRTRDLKASHGKVLESPKEFNDLPPDDKACFLQLAQPIEKLRLLLIVVVLVLGEAYAMNFFHHVDPQLAEKLIPPWLLEIL